jgi:putative tricarboxylic transport membrane protein
MSDKSQPAADGPSHRAVEIGVAIFTGLFAVIVIAGSVSAGIGWGVEGPKAGFFPFYVGLFILGGSIVNFVNIIAAGRSDKLFAEWDQLRQVLSVVIPSAIYVALIPSLGIYVCSIAIIAVFMRWLGKYRWSLVAAVSVGVPAFFYVMFEKWFLVPLPKGPIEDLLGL